MLVSRKRRLHAGAAVALALATAACSSQGGARNASASADTPHYTFALISHAPAGDAFFDVIQNGAKEAAAKDDVTVKYSSSNDATEEAGFIDNAVASKVDGIAVSIPNPDALRPAIQRAVAAGIPVVAYNAGDRAWQSTGALSFFGEPEFLAGQFAGDELNRLGAKHALCVPQAQGQVQLEDRCAGLADKFQGTVDKLYANGTDLPSYVSTVSAKLQQDPTIDAVVTLAPDEGVAMANQLAQTRNDKVKVATYAFNSSLIPLLQDGTVAFTIDQQPYLQGYGSIDALWLYKRNKGVLGAGQSLPTGPVVINRDNVGEITGYITQGLR